MIQTLIGYVATVGDGGWGVGVWVATLAVRVAMAPDGGIHMR